MIIGVGNTAMDCCRTSLRLGAENVKVMARKPRAYFKASAWELEDAEEENIEITVKAGTKVNHGKEDIVKVDNNLIVKEIYTTDINLLTGLQICIVPYKNSKIIQNDNIIGKLDIEAIVNLQDGVIKDLEGQSEVKLTMKGISD